MSDYIAGSGIQVTGEITPSLKECDCPCGQGKVGYFDVRLNEYCTKCSQEIFALVNDSKLKVEEIRKKLIEK